MAYAKTFRIDPESGDCFEACDRPGEGDVICELYGSQMKHSVIARRQLQDGTWIGKRFTVTEWNETKHETWERVLCLIN